MKTSIKSLIVPLMLLIAAGLFIAACTEVPDRCGFTWTQKWPPADAIFIHRVQSEAEMPAPEKPGDADCRLPGTLGCTRFSWRDGKMIADIYLNSTKMIVGSQCDTLRHEIEHALGGTHPNGERLS